MKEANFCVTDIRRKESPAERVLVGGLLLY